jgi:Tfp pilus assembly protein PilF
MTGRLICCFLCHVAWAAEYELAGRISPPAKASVVIYGATTPFTSATRSDPHGRFRFRRLAAGTYILSIEELSRGEFRQTIEIGPGTADVKGRVDARIEADSRQFEGSGAQRRGATVSATDLAVPVNAAKEYREAQRFLERRDAAMAVSHLQQAVHIAPRFSAAWNQLGTIAYQSARYTDAEGYFRNALEADADAFEPLVNLGGVLLNLEKPREALDYNLRAVERRPNDALANSQLGMSYLENGDLDMAEKFLTIAKRIDPAHFSKPQLLLAQIHERRREQAAAIEELEDYLKRHPDAVEAARVKETISRLEAALK